MPDDESLIRTRQFPASHSGPYNVSIREKDVKVSPIQFSMYLNKTFKSIVSIKRFPTKIKVELSDRNEVNLLLADEIFQNYILYLPANEVEIDGVVSLHDLCDINGTDDIVLHGKGPIQLKNHQKRK